jgi:hypothetical protein
MSYFETPNGERYEIFGSSNGPELVEMTGAPLLAQLPIDPVLTSLCDAGRIEEYRGSAYEMLAENFVKTLKIARCGKAAVGKLGAQLVPVGYRMKGPEIAYLVADSRAKVIVGAPLNRAVSVLTNVPFATPGIASQFPAVLQDVSVPVPDQLPVAANACRCDRSDATAPVAIAQVIEQTGKLEAVTLAKSLGWIVDGIGVTKRLQTS